MDEIVSKIKTTWIAALINQLIKQAYHAAGGLEADPWHWPVA